MQVQERTREVIAEVRSAIASALAASATSTLESVLSDPDSGCVLVVKVLDVHRCLGKVAGRRAMNAASVRHGARIAELTGEQRVRLAAECTCAS